MAITRYQGDTTNLAAARPRRVKKMKRALDQWRAQAGAKMPTANPGYRGE